MTELRRLPYFGYVVLNTVATTAVVAFGIVLSDEGMPSAGGGIIIAALIASALVGAFLVAARLKNMGWPIIPFVCGYIGLMVGTLLRTPELAGVGAICSVLLFIFGLCLLFVPEKADA